MIYDLAAKPMVKNKYATYKKYSTYSKIRSSRN